MRLCLPARIDVVGDPRLETFNHRHYLIGDSVGQIPFVSSQTVRIEMREADPLGECPVVAELEVLRDLKTDDLKDTLLLVELCWS